MIRQGKNNDVEQEFENGTLEKGRCPQENVGRLLNWIYNEITEVGD